MKDEHMSKLGWRGAHLINIFKWTPVYYIFIAYVYFQIIFHAPLRLVFDNIMADIFPLAP